MIEYQVQGQVAYGDKKKEWSAIGIPFSSYDKAATAIEIFRMMTRGEMPNSDLVKNPGLVITGMVMVDLMKEDGATITYRIIKRTIAEEVMDEGVI